MYFGRLAYISGWMLLIVGLAELAPLLIALVEGEQAALRVFARSSAITCGVAVLLILAFQGVHAVRDRRAAFLLAPVSSLVIGMFAALPFAGLGGVPFYQAAFEAFSGVTTSGATVFPVLADLPQSLIFWRSLLGWMGGLGFVLVCLAIYFNLNIGGFSLARNLLPHGEGTGLLARLRGNLHPLFRIYLLLSLVIVVLLWGAGEGFLGALNLGLSAISTSGFLPYDGALTMGGGRLSEAILMLAMLAGTINMTFYRHFLRGRFDVFQNDPEVAGLAGVVALSLPIMAFIIITLPQMPGVTALWDGLFLVVSAISTTGFVPEGVILLPLMGTIVLLTLAAVGGSSGSNAGGIKLFRMLLILRQAGRELRRLAHPHRSETRRYGDLIIEIEEMDAILLTVFGFFFSFSIGLIGLSAFGLDYDQAAVVAITALSSSGAMAPALISDFPGFWTLTEAQSWIVVALMIVGRLEVAICFTILTKNFWSR